MKEGIDSMTNKEIVETLNKAAEFVKDNIAMRMLLIVAAERIKHLDQKIRDMDWQINPERMGQ